MELHQLPRHGEVSSVEGFFVSGSSLIGPVQKRHAVTSCVVIVESDGLAGAGGPVDLDYIRIRV